MVSGDVVPNDHTLSLCEANSVVAGGVHERGVNRGVGGQIPARVVTNVSGFGSGNRAFAEETFFTWNCGGTLNLEE